VPKLRDVYVCCAGCAVRSTNLIDDHSATTGEATLVSEGWMPAMIRGSQCWFCATCALTPDESRVVVALRGGP